MLSRTRFFFTKNSTVLQTLNQTKICRLALNSRVTKSAGVRNFFNTQRSHVSTALKSDGWNAAVHTEGIKLSGGQPVISSRTTGLWLLGTSGLVFGIVVLGGLTRLTESGLSITEWKPVTGALPPLSQKHWEEEFEKYQESPEFKQLNSHITLEEFKFIYSMEWGHRLVGRLIGAFFILPVVYFWSRKRFSFDVKWKVVTLTALLGLQGAIGWWMVKSGLDETQLSERNSKPTVSQYRLTTHLGAAFLMYLGVLWTGIEILRENKWFREATKGNEAVSTVFSKLNNPAMKKLRYVGAGLLSLVFFTAMSGGMVAGLDAGLIYNTFPHMGDDLLPSTLELMSPVFSRKPDQSDLWWRNLLENPTTVQLVHRILATTTFFTVLAAHLYANKYKKIMPAAARKIMHAAMGIATLQVALGISTLIYLVPIPLAAAHQAGALALLTACLTFLAQLKKPRPQTYAFINDIMKKKLQNVTRRL